MMKSIFFALLVSLVASTKSQGPIAYGSLQKRLSLKPVINTAGKQGAKQMTLLTLKSSIKMALRNLNPKTASLALKSFTKTIPAPGSLSKLLRPPAPQKIKIKAENPPKDPARADMSLGSNKIQTSPEKSKLSKVQSAAAKNWLNKLKELGAEFTRTTVAELKALGISVVSGAAYTVLTDKSGVPHNVRIDPISGIPQTNAYEDMIHNRSQFYYLGHPKKITDPNTGIEFYLDTKIRQYYCRDQKTGERKYYLKDNTDVCKPIKDSENAQNPSSDVGPKYFRSYRNLFKYFL